MTPHAIRITERLRPLVVLGAVSLHAIAAAAIPKYVPTVSQMFDPAAFVEVEAEVPEPARIEAPPPPERVVVRNVPRPVREEPQPPPQQETPPPAPTEETQVGDASPTSEPALPAMAVGTGGTMDVAGSASGTNGLGVVGSQVTSTPTPAPAAIDLRPLLRGYVALLNSAVRIPRLRGVTEPVDAMVVVGLRVSANGQINAVRIVRSSGHPMIDQHILEAFRNHPRLPAPPPELDLARREFTYRVQVGG